MITRLATLLCLAFGQSASGQTAILCTAQEQWTFAEDIGRPANWAFNVEFEVHGQQISHFKVGGMRCSRLYEVYVNDESIGFKCNLQGTGASESAEYFTSISRLAGDFIIIRTYERSKHLDGATIGLCQRGSRRF